MNATRRLLRTVRRRERQRLLVRYLVHALIAAVVVGIFTGLFDMISSAPAPIMTVTLAAVGAAAAGSLVVACFKRLDTKRLLVRAERVIGTSSLLITAMEIESSSPSHPFAEALTERAETAARRASEARLERDVVPVRPPRPTLLLPVLMVVLFLVYLGAGELRARAVDPPVLNAGAFLEEYGDTLAARAEEDSLAESLAIAKEMQRLGRELQNNRVDREDVEQMIAELSERVRGRVSGLSRSAQPDVSRPPDRAPTPEEGRAVERAPSASQIEQLYRDLFQKRRITDEEADFLEETLEKLDSPEDASGIDADALDRLDELASRRNLMEERDALDSAERALERARQYLDQADAPAGTAQGRESGGGAERTLEPGDDESAPGRRPAGGRNAANGESGEADGEGSSSAGDLPVKDKTDSDFRRSGNVASTLGELSGELTSRESVVQRFVRTMPEDSKTAAEFRDIRRTYAEQIERALVREAVPIAMRSYVRDYFLRIGETDVNETNGRSSHE